MEFSRYLGLGSNLHRKNENHRLHSEFGAPTNNRFCRYLDYCLLMGYDFNRFNHLFRVVEFNSPLHPHDGQVGILAMLNIVEASELWVEKGVYQWEQFREYIPRSSEILENRSDSFRGHLEMDSRVLDEERVDSISNVHGWQ